MSSEQSQSTAAKIISVCMAYFNGLDLIGTCLSSERGQTTTFRVELFIHDKASTDASVAHIRKYHPDVGLIEQEHRILSRRQRHDRRTWQLSA